VIRTLDATLVDSDLPVCYLDFDLDVLFLDSEVFAPCCGK